MGNIGNTIVLSARPGIAMAPGACAPIDPAHFADLPKGAAGDHINTNHPNFVMGHLCLYPAKVLDLLEIDSSEVQAPESWHAMYKAGVTCDHAASGSGPYAPKDELLEFFSRTHAYALERVADVPDEFYLREHPDAVRRQKFPTIGVMTNFYLTSHIMLHAGQLSAWRRMMGYGSIM